MALSNWDTLALNEKNEFCGGSFLSPSGVVVEFYKNWIYVQDEKAWDEKSGWTKPIVMEIQEGAVYYKDIYILAFRGPQSGIYAAVWNYEYPKESSQNVIITGMVGCGVYGYSEKDFVGVLQSSLDWFQAKLLEFKDSEYSIPEVFRKPDFLNARRMNSGDKYFNGVIDAGIAATPVGVANPPIVMDIIKNIS